MEQRPTQCEVKAWPLPPTETDSQRGQVRKLRFHGTGGSLYGIHIVNMLLTGLTLGIYYFWGKVKVRNYIFSQSEFEGDRFAYHGTGKELLIGWLRGNGNPGSHLWESCFGLSCISRVQRSVRGQML